MVLRQRGVVAPVDVLWTVEEPLAGTAVCRLDHIASQIHVVEPETIDDLACRRGLGRRRGRRGALIYWSMIAIVDLISKLSS